MQNRPNKKILFISFILLLLFCSGCIHTSNINDDDNSKKDTLIWGVLSKECIYPLGVTNDNYYTIIPNIYDGLVEFDEDFRIVPALAVSWNNPNNLSSDEYDTKVVSERNTSMYLIG
jgi:ABC-type transport system substrate-binding protein